MVRRRQCLEGKGSKKEGAGCLGKKRKAWCGAQEWSVGGEVTGACVCMCMFESSPVFPQIHMLGVPPPRTSEGDCIWSQGLYKGDYMTMMSFG